MSLIERQKNHISQLLSGIQRCAYHLAATEREISWPLEAGEIAMHKKDALFMRLLSSYNERFAKLQDVVAATMRHGALLWGQSDASFLKVLAWYEKRGVIADIESWQLIRLTRNQAAHDYDVDFAAIAEHFNALHALSPSLLRTAGRIVALCQDELGVQPDDPDFVNDFAQIIAAVEDKQ